MYSPLAMPTPIRITLGPTRRRSGGASGSSRSSDAARVKRPVTGSVSTTRVCCISPPHGSLRGHPHGGVDGAVAVVAPAPLEHLEEQPALEGAVEVQELAVAGAVVEHVELPQLVEVLELIPGGEIRVVVVGDRQDRCAALAHRARRGERVGAGEGDVL